MLYGLALVGGLSSRMKKDKAWLHYDGIPQYQRLQALLNGHCEKVLFSCRKEQCSLLPSNYITVIDQYTNIGPMAGVLTAFKVYPKIKAFFVVACDLPYLNEGLVKQLISNRRENKTATCFVHPTKQQIEPLCCIYERTILVSLLQAYENKQYSLKKVLEQTNSQHLYSARANELKNVNTPKDYRNYSK